MRNAFAYGFEVGLGKMLNGIKAAYPKEAQPTLKGRFASAVGSVVGSSRMKGLVPLLFAMIFSAAEAETSWDRDAYLSGEPAVWVEEAEQSPRSTALASLQNEPSLTGQYAALLGQLKQTWNQQSTHDNALLKRLNQPLQRLEALDLLYELRLQDMEAKIKGYNTGLWQEYLTTHQARLTEFKSAYRQYKDSPGNTDNQNVLIAELGKLLAKLPEPAHPILGNDALPYSPTSSISLSLNLDTVAVSYNQENVSPGSDDLASVPAAALSNAVLKQAEALDYDPIRILNFVRQEIRTEWYSGVLKGADHTLATLSGNDADQAALLVSLLRASHIPARFVRGVVEVPIDELKVTLGLTDANDIPVFFAKAGIAAKVVIQGGKPSAYQFDHVWVSAYIPYTNYRGALVDTSGALWLPLDTSFKPSVQALETPVSERAGLNLTEVYRQYIDQASNNTASIDQIAKKSPLEFFRIAADQGLRDSGITDPYQVILQRSVARSRADTLDFIPSSLPFKVRSVYHESSRIPDAWLQQLHLSVYPDEAGLGASLLQKELPLYQIYNQRLTLSYIADSIDDQELTNLYGGLGNVPAYLIRTRPQLKLGGMLHSVGDGGLELGRNHRLEMKLVTSGHTETFTKTLLSGNYHSLAIGHSNIRLDFDSKDNQADTESAAARILSQAGYRYLQAWETAETELADAMGHTLLRPLPSLVFVSGLAQVERLFDQPESVDIQGIQMDAKFRPVNSFRGHPDAPHSRAWRLQAGVQGSYLEHQLFQDDLGLSSLSTIKGLQKAKQDGIELLVVTSANLDTSIDVLAASHAQPVLDHIEYWVNQGYEVTIPGSEITQNLWKGSVWTVQHPGTEAAGYFISGGMAGGVSTIIPLISEALAYLRSAYTGTPNLNPNQAVALLPVSATDYQELGVGELSEPFQVRVFDIEAKHVVEAEVEFSIDGGGATFEDGSTLSRVKTDEHGIAEVTIKAGNDTSINPAYFNIEGTRQRVSLQLVTARLMSGGNTHSSHTFLAAASPGAVVELELVNRLSAPDVPIKNLFGFILAKALDEYGNPVYGTEITASISNTGTVTPTACETAPVTACGTGAAKKVMTPADPAPSFVFYGAQDLGGETYVDHTIEISAEDVKKSLTARTLKPGTGLTFSTSVPQNVGRDGQNMLALRAGEPGAVDLIESPIMYSSVTQEYYRPKAVESSSSTGPIAPFTYELGGNGSVSTFYVDALEQGLHELTHYYKLTYHDDDEAVSAGWDDNSVSNPLTENGGLRGFVWGLEFESNVESGAIELDSDFRSLDPITLDYTLKPAEFLADRVEVEVLARLPGEEATTAMYMEGTGRQDNGYVTLPNITFDPEKHYSYRIVVNRGHRYEVLSEEYDLPIRPISLLGLPEKVYQQSFIIPPGGGVNGLVCPQEYEYSFNAVQPGTAKITETDTISGEKLREYELELETGNHHLGFTDPGGSRAEHEYHIDLTYTQKVTGIEDEFRISVQVKRTKARLPAVSHMMVQDVDLLDGALVFSEVDLDLGGRGQGLSFSRTYSSNNHYRGDAQFHSMGKGWSHNYSSKAYKTTCGVLVNGILHVETPDPGVYKAVSGYHSTVTETDDEIRFYSKSGVLHQYTHIDDLASSGALPGISLDIKKGEYRLSHIEDTNGNRTTLAYEGGSPDASIPLRLSTVTDSSGRTLSFSYGKLEDNLNTQNEDEECFLGVPHPGDFAYDLLTAVRFSDGRYATYTYDQVGRLREVGQFGGEAGEETSSTRKYEYEIPLEECSNDGSAAWFSLASPSGESFEPWERYYRQHLISKIIDERGYSSEFDYTLAGYMRQLDSENIEDNQVFVSQVTLPGGRATKYWYSGRDFPAGTYKTTVTNPRGHLDQYTLSYMGNALEVEKPNGTVNYSWDASHLLMTGKVDERGITTLFEYDEFGNRVSEKIEGEPAVESTFELLGEELGGGMLRIKNRIATRTDREGFITSFLYDESGNLTEKNFSAPNVMGLPDGVSLICKTCNELYTYGDNGDRLSQTDRNGNRTHFNYDENGFLTRTTRPDKTVVNHSYNSQGWLQDTTDANGNKTAFEYDGLGRRLWVRYTGEGSSKGFTYDEAGNKLSETDENGNTTSWTYTPEGWVDTITQATGETYSYGYDAHGNITSETDWNGNGTTHVYNDADRQTESQLPLGKLIKRKFDEVGNVLRVDHHDGVYVEKDYDDYGRVVEVRSSYQAGVPAVTTTEYDGNGNAIKVVSPNGGVTEFKYNNQNLPVYRVETLTLAEGSPAEQAATVYVYDGQGNQVSEIDALGNERRVEYDAMNRPVKQFDFNGNRTDFNYDAAGNRISTTDSAGFVTHYGYNTRGWLTSEKNALGQVTSHTYDNVGNRETSTQPNGNHIVNEFDKLNRLTKTTDKEGVIGRKEYDANGNLVLEADGNGHETIHKYDALNRKVQTTLPDLVDLTFAYDLNNQLKSRTDGRGKTWTYDYNLAGNRVSETRPDSTALGFKYDKQGNRTQATDGLGNITSWTYNESNQVLVETDAKNQTLTTEYDLKGRVLRQTDKRDIATIYSYDAQGNRLTESRNGVLLLTQKYDYRHLVVQSTDAKGNKTSYEYDRLGRQTAVNRPESIRTTSEHNDSARTLKRTDGAGRQVLEQQDYRGRMLSRTQGLGSPAEAITHFEYDGNGNRTRLVKPEGNAWVYHYDALNRLTQVDDPAHQPTRLEYDANGNHTATVDALGKRTEYDYDDVNRRTVIRYPDAAEHVFVWDKGDNLDFEYQPNGIRIDYSYDALNRLTLQTHTGTGPLDGLAGQSIAYQYDANNNLTQASLTDGIGSFTLNYRHDAFDRLHGHTDAHGFEHSFGYDLNGNRTRYTFDDDHTSYYYDGVNRLTGLQNQGLSSSYDYYADGRLKHQNRSNHTQTAYRYNGRGLVERIGHSNNGSPLASVDYQYDQNNNRTDQWEDNGRGEEHTQYDYDELDRLTGVQYPDVPLGEGSDVVYGYDAVGNRIAETHTNQAAEAVVQQRGYLYNDRHQLTGIDDHLDATAGIRYQYDANGNQTQQIRGSGAEATTTDYRYDLRNQMTAVDEDGHPLHSARYDHQGLRIRSESLAGVRLYSYDGQSAVAVHDHNGDLVNRYHYGPTQLDRLLDPSIGVQYYHQDALGSPIALTESNGQIAARYAYDAFGQYRRKEVINTQNPFGFTGHEYDEATDLLYAKARYYDPETARFLAQDPFEGHLDRPPSLHKYLYAYQNPTVFVDPDGREACYGQPLEGCPEPLYIPDGEETPQIVARDALDGQAEMTEVAMDRVVEYLAERGGEISANHKMSIYSNNFRFVPHFDENRDVLFYSAIANTKLEQSAYIVPPNEIDRFIAEEGFNALMWSASHVLRDEMSPWEVSYNRAMGRALGGDAGAFSEHMGDMFESMQSGEYATQMGASALAGYMGAGFASPKTSGNSSRIRGDILENIRTNRNSKPTNNFSVYLAKEQQIVSGYKADDWQLGTIKEGTIVYGGVPGQSAFYTDFSTVKNSRLDAAELFQSLQVSPHPVFGYRPQIQAYRVTRDIEVPQGQVLENPDLGLGGGHQYLIKEYQEVLEPIRTFELVN